MSSAGTAYIDIEARADGLAADIDAAVAAANPAPVDVEVNATVDQAQAEIDSLSSDPVDVEVGAVTEPAQAEIDAIDGGTTETVVTADTSQAQGAVDDLAGSLGDLGDAAGEGGGALGDVTAELGGLAGSAGGAALGIGSVVAGLGMAIDAAGEAEAVNAKLAQILETTGANAYISQGQINQLSTEIMEYSGQSDEAVNSAATLLLTFEGVSNQASIQNGIFERSVKATADIAALMGGDATGAALRLGRALDDPVRGMSMLQRSGVSFTESQKTMIQSLYESGDVLGAQAELLNVVEGQVGGVAEAYGDTMKGGLDKAKQSVDELAESFGSTLLPTIEGLASAIGPATEGLQSLDDSLNGVLLSGPVQAIQGIGDGIRGVGTFIGELPPPLQDTASAADEAAAAIADLDAEIDAYLSGLYDVPGAQRDAQQAIADLAAAMTDTEATWYDQAEAQEEVVRNTAEMIAVMNEQGATQPELDAAIANTIGMLRAERDAGHITEQQFQDLSTEIRNVPHKASTPVTAPGLLDVFHRTQDYRAEMNRVDATNPSSSFSSPGLASSLNDSIRYSAQISNLDGRTVTTYFKRVDFSAPLPKYAAGTESAAAGWAIVGENGPELVGFAGGERVLPAGQTAAAMERGGTPAPSIVVNVHGTATAADGQAVVDALRRWQQRNGPVPVKVSA